MKKIITLILQFVIITNLFANINTPDSLVVSNYQYSKLSKTNVKNLSLLGQVWTFLKYHHPAISNPNCNWDNELFCIIPKIITTKNKTETEIILLNWIDSLGKIEIDSYRNKEKAEPFMTTDTSLFTNHYIDNILLRQKLKEIHCCGFPRPSRYVQFPFVPIFDGEIPYDKSDLSDARYRLLALYRYWGAVNYFFPYRYAIVYDWNKVLEEMIPFFVAAKTDDDYQLAIARLSALTNDTHANFNVMSLTNRCWGQYCTSAVVQYVENKPTVVHFRSEDKGGLQIGDVIKRINKKTVQRYEKYYKPYLATSNEGGKWRNIGYNLTRSNDSILNMTIKRDGERMNITIPAKEEFKLNVISLKEVPDPIRIIDSVLYVYVACDAEQIRNALTQKDDYKGIILDMRCYPMNWDEGIMEYLGGDSTVYVRFAEMDREYFGQSVKTTNYRTGGPNKDWYNRPVVIIVNEHTQSMAEFLVMELQQFPKAYTIGSQTAGADGNVTFINLPGGYQGRFSSIGVYYSDWGETQRVGVRINEVVKPTIKGIRKGEDELLIKAIEIINR